MWEVGTWVLSKQQPFLNNLFKFVMVQMGWRGLMSPSLFGGICFFLTGGKQIKSIILQHHFAPCLSNALLMKAPLYDRPFIAHRDCDTGSLPLSRTLIL